MLTNRKYSGRRPLVVVAALLSLMILLPLAGCKNDTVPEPTRYTVTFNTNGGSEVASQTVESGKTASTPADPTKDGWTFQGWYEDSDLTKGFNFSTPVTADIILYAKWRVVVAFVTSGGTATNYATLDEAINSAAKGSTLTLKADITGATRTITIPAGKDFTLDLNGHTIKGVESSGSLLRVQKDATLIITDSSQQKNGTITTTDYCGVDNHGILTVNGGAISAAGNGVANSGGLLTVSGGSISGKKYGVHNTIIDHDVLPTTTVTGGTISGVHFEWGTLYLSGNSTITGKLRVCQPITLVGELTGTGTYAVEYVDGSILAEGGSATAGGTAYEITKSDMGKFALDSDTLKLENNKIVVSQ